ncbi:D-2-hydroxyacid dehydrogenase family protein [Salinibacterium sp. NSLL150]|uniref:2-hydroxyacid dehydrogenase n=1 Tax=unclassified Salinibacterium TaxID=2632331 RepID=UPI0018CF178B|nr:MULTISPECIES: NAD(P)-dependent oxidoreductase [unclassified Salinibacterium]MBH0097522.1 D-2-hydroxyacid dehydrogenase family protein [Salinibacterium sp. NSLL35]MBH0100277.1 D-2-hydroxyacid dehydrogenase family protein [Salinibacterium sp. NSLL150]MBH0103036.1 D-2-hydroxyacid dehydrogenase family protein [Salinibacterium sp. NSLL16]MBH0105797.1 D-2-hydroxyacid dehydrogenase family protein [Salinibacterium sp. NSLL17]
MKIVCIDGESQYREIVERDVKIPLEKLGHTFDWFEESFDDIEAATARAAGYDVLYVVGDQGPVPAGLMKNNPGLRMVSFVGTGARRFVSMDEAAASGVTVTNVPDFASQSVAEHAIALMFAVARRVVEGDAIVRSGEWAKNQGLKLAGRRLGVVGAGAIGARVITMAKALGMDVVYWSRTASPERDEALGAPRVELEELFETCDVVSLHLIHNKETDGMIGRSLLERMRPTAILVNTARAEVMDNVALKEIVEAGAIFGAGLDVFVEEPPSASVIPGAATNSVLAPHIGFHTDEADDVFRLAGENIVAFAAGTPTNVID